MCYKIDTRHQNCTSSLLVLSPLALSHSPPQTLFLYHQLFISIQFFRNSFNLRYVFPSVYFLISPTINSPIPYPGLQTLYCSLMS